MKVLHFHAYLYLHRAVSGFCFPFLSGWFSVTRPAPVRSGQIANYAARLQVNDSFLKDGSFCVWVITGIDLKGLCPKLKPGESTSNPSDERATVACFNIRGGKAQGWSSPNQCLVLHTKVR